MPNTSTIIPALAWACIIILVAFVMQSQGVSDPASAGIVFGLTGAAWGSLQSDTPCGRGCLQ